MEERLWTMDLISGSMIKTGGADGVPITTKNVMPIDIREVCGYVDSLVVSEGHAIMKVSLFEKWVPQIDEWLAHPSFGVRFATARGSVGITHMFMCLSTKGYPVNTIRI